MAEKVASVLGEGRLSAKDVAAACGISPQAINGWKKSGRVAKHHLPVLVQMTGLPLEWWIPGATPNLLRDNISSKDQIEVWSNAEDLSIDPDRVWVDRYDLSCSAGDGMIQWEVRQKRALPFTHDFFKSLGSRPEDCRLVTARGHSMEPFLFDRDLIMLDVKKTTVRDANIYAVRFEGETFVKQIFKQAGGALTLHSYNSKYPDRVVPASEDTEFEVIGQVIYRSGSGLPGH